MPIRRLAPINKTCAPLFDQLLARLQTGDPRRAWHQMDRMCFYRFIWCAHTTNSGLTPTAFAGHLQAGGVPADVVEKLRQAYEMGRQLLACRIHPWSRRSRG
jgi:hypothetical protein